MTLGLGFLNPWALWLLPLAAIPIVIHLLNRRRFNKVRWAAMTFLLAAMKRNRRRMRMEQWLILLLRTLAVILLVLLVSRPQFEDGVFGSVRKHHVVCLDDSASMTHRGPADTAFEAATKRINEIAEKLSRSRSGDLFTLFASSDPDHPLLPVTRVSPDLPSRVREALAKARPGDGRFDSGTALAAATRAFEASEDAEHVEYHVVTDLRKADWLDADGEPNEAAKKWLLGRDAQKEDVSIHGVGSNDTDNLAISALTCRERVCTAGLPLVFAVDVTNRGFDTTTAIELSVQIDDRTRTTYPVPPLGAGETTTIEFAHTFYGAGAHGVTASLPSDRFEVDDVRALSIDVRPSSRVLVVDGDPGDSPEESETYFLHAALEIRGEINSGVEVRLIAEHEVDGITDEEFAEFDMVWMCNVGRPSERFVDRLDTFVRGGGGAVFFLGNQVDIGHYNDRLYRNGKGILPSRLVEVAGDIDDKQPVHLASKDAPLFATNTEEVEFMFEQLVSIGRYVQLESAPTSNAQVLLRVEDDEGPPLLVSRDSDAGRVFLVATTADALWTSWPVWPVFVMTVLPMHREAARPQDFTRWNLTPQGKAEIDFDPGRLRADLTVTPADDPTGEIRTFSAQATGEDGTGSIEVPMSDLDGYGLFAVEQTRHDGSTKKSILARNGLLEEGALDRLSPEAFRRGYPEELADRLSVTAEGTSSGSGGNVVDASGDVWRWSGFALLIGMLLETLLAWRFGRR